MTALCELAIAFALVAQTAPTPQPRSPEPSSEDAPEAAPPASEDAPSSPVQDTRRDPPGSPGNTPRAPPAGPGNTPRAPPAGPGKAPRAPPASPGNTPPAPPSGIPPQGITLSGSSISGVTLSGATITGATVTGATITGATITSAHISGATISGATFSGDTVSGGTVAGGTIAGGTIHGGTVSGGTISGGTISGGTISGSAGSASKGGSSQTPGEQAPAAQTAPQTPPAQPPAAQTPPAQAPAAQTPAAQPPAAQPGREGQPTTTAPHERGKHASSSERDPRTKRESARPGKRAPAGGDDDEDDLAARALQHLLVERGALLLPIWGLEIAPGFSYSHTGRDTFILVPGETEASPPTTVALRRRSHQLTGVLSARLGLPWDFQLEASMPAVRGWSDATIAGAASQDTSGFGLGDPTVSLTWQLLHAGSFAPDLFIAGTWKPQVGSSPFDAGAREVGVGAGYTALGGTLTAVKTSDPLVLLASATYTDNLGVDTKVGRREPGNTWGFGGGAILAVSPETSMQFLVDFHYKPEDRLKNKALPGSDETAAVLQLGLGTVISRRTLLNVSVGIGLTADSPDLQLGVSVPIRFY